MSWRWPCLMWNMTWGKWICARCGEIICEMLPLYQSLFAWARVCVCVCLDESVWYACPCMILWAYMPPSAGGIGHENSMQKVLQQTGNDSWIWASAEWAGSEIISVYRFYIRKKKSAVCCKFVVRGALSNHVSAGFGVCRMAVCTMSKSRRNAIHHNDIPAPIGVNLTLIYLSP